MCLLSSQSSISHRAPLYRGSKNSICRRWRGSLRSLISGQTLSSANWAAAACFRSRPQAKPGLPPASQRDRPCNASAAWPRDATCLSLAAGEVKSLHFGTECHGGFSPAAVQIRDDLSQALCEASWSSRAEEGAGRREGAGEVTLLQKHTPASSGDTAGPIQQFRTSRSGPAASRGRSFGFFASLNYHSGRGPTTVTLKMKRFANNAWEPSEDLAMARCSLENLLRLLRDASAAISMATGYCSIRSESNSWRHSVLPPPAFSCGRGRGRQTDGQSDRQADSRSASQSKDTHTDRQTVLA